MNLIYIYTRCLCVANSQLCRRSQRAQCASIFNVARAVAIRLKIYFYQRSKSDARAFFYTAQIGLLYLCAVRTHLSRCI